MKIFEEMILASEYEPWGGAVPVWYRFSLEEQSYIDDMLSDLYPEGLELIQLNDLLWFETEWVLESLEIDEESFWNRDWYDMRRR